IGVEKVQAITYSASAISSLTDNQIRDIINCFPKNSNVDDSSVKYQEMISVTNCNAQVTEPSNSNDISTTKVSHISNSENMINGKVKTKVNAESSCPICKLNNEDEDGISGEYKNGSYYIK
ncbi:3116_t:CDS:2, partial [Diversispora eburnea]